MDASVFTAHRQVEFRDTDAAGIMHFSIYFTYMEEVEHEFLRSLGTSVVMPLPASGESSDNDLEPTVDFNAASGKISWPRVAAECQYRGSARFEDRLKIELRVTQLGTSSVTYSFCFKVDDTEIATGSLTTVCCRFIPGLPPESTPIPADLRKQLAPLVAT